MDGDKQFSGRHIVSDSLASVASTAQEVQKTWSFAPASQPSMQIDINDESSMNYHGAAESMNSPRFRKNSLDLSSQNSEEGVLRSRRQVSQKTARFLPVKREKDGRVLHPSSLVLEPAHTLPVSSPHSFSPPCKETVQLHTLQYPETGSSRSSDLSGSLKQKLSFSSRHQQDFFMHKETQLHTLQYPESGSSRSSDVSGSLKQTRHQQDCSALPICHTSTKPRKTLQERLLGEQPLYSGLSQSPSHPNQCRLYRTSVKHEQTPLLPAPVAAEPLDARMSLGVLESDGGASSLNFGKEDIGINARSRSASVIDTPGDTKGMQGVVMEAMRSIQRFESENEMQVRTKTSVFPTLLSAYLPLVL